MNSISFPKMFTSSSTNIIKNLDATKLNTYLLLKSEQGEFISDPYFGLKAKQFLFEQNSFYLKDILIDEIYTKILAFMPQLIINRADIDIVQSGSYIYAKFKAQNKIDFETNMYQIVIFNSEEM